MSRLLGWMSVYLPVLVLAFANPLFATDSDEDPVEGLWEEPRWSDQIPMNLLRFWEDIGDRAGFEIGNGRKLIKNVNGMYLLKIYKDWEAGTLDKLTEIISPLHEGIPRARLRINVMQGEKREMIRQILEKKEAQDWVPVVLDQLNGLQKQTVQPSGIHEVEVRLFRDTGETILLHMDGRPGEPNAPTAFDKVQSALSTFQTLAP